MKILISQQNWEGGQDTNTCGAPEAQPLCPWGETEGREQQLASGASVCARAAWSGRSPTSGTRGPGPDPTGTSPARLRGAGAPLLPLFNTHLLYRTVPHVTGVFGMYL